MKRAILCLLLLPYLAFGQDVPQFMRLKKDAKGRTIAMEVACTKYTNKDKSIVVYLDGVCHFADNYYYQTLNKRFKQRDCVLYELVGPSGSKPLKQREGVAFWIREGIMTFLDIDSQLKRIDYTPDNFVHSDMSWDAMMEVASKRGENGLSLALGFFADMVVQQNLAKMRNDRPFEEIFQELMRDPTFIMKMVRDPNIMKRDLAKSLVESEPGVTMKKLLIEYRNEECCKVLKQEIIKGKKNISIFWGAAHNPDFHHKLMKDFGLHPVEQEWLIAWDMTDEYVDQTLRLLRILTSQD